MTDAVKLDENVARRERWPAWAFPSLNNMSSKEAQLETISSLLIKQPFDDTEILLSILKALFEEDDVTFRKWLREEIYHKLLRKKTERGPRDTSKSIVGAVPQRILVLSEVIQGWRWNHRGDDNPILSPDTEECFKFLCVSYVDFDHIEPSDSKGSLLEELEKLSATLTKSPFERIEGDKFRKEIRNLLTKHLNGKLSRKGPPFLKEDGLEDWLQREYIPRDFENVLSHKIINILDPEERKRRLTTK